MGMGMGGQYGSPYGMQYGNVGVVPQQQYFNPYGYGPQQQMSEYYNPYGDNYAPDPYAQFLQQMQQIQPQQQQQPGAQYNNQKPTPMNYGQNYDQGRYSGTGGGFDQTAGGGGMGGGMDMMRLFSMFGLRPY
jgi:hypothetical protein